MNNLLDKYADFVVFSLNLSIGQPVEIVTPIECEFFCEHLIKKLMIHTHDIFVTTTNSKREDNPHLDEAFYDNLMKREFVRITITSPFTLSRDSYFTEYQTEELYEYFHNNTAQRTMIALPNDKWAEELHTTPEDLLKSIMEISQKENKLAGKIKLLNSLRLDRVIITTSLGTNLSIELTKDFSFNYDHQKSKRDIPFRINYPSLEIFTSPVKTGVNGVIYSSKPIYIKDKLIPSFMLEFKDGKVINQRGLDSILKLEEGLNYVGELGLAEFDSRVFLSTLIDENLSTHIALGNSYTMGIKESEKDKLNYSKYHVDLPIGTADMKIIGISGNAMYLLFDEGKYAYKE